MDKDSRLYGECAYLLDKIFDKTEEMGGWDELINMLARIDEDKFQTEEERYLCYYRFISLVYWRIRPWDEPQPFNRVTKKEVLIDVTPGPVPKARYGEGYNIWNYDYKWYLWCRKHNLVDALCPAYFEVPTECLSPAQIKRFEQLASNS